MAHIKLYCLSGESWVKVQDSDTSGATFDIKGILSGAGPNHCLQLRMDSGYQTISVSPYDEVRVRASGAFAENIQFAHNVGGNPSGTWSNQQYVIPVGSEIESSGSRQFWLRLNNPSGSGTTTGLTGPYLVITAYTTEDFSCAATSPPSGYAVPSGIPLYMTFNKQVMSSTVAAYCDMRNDIGVSFTSAALLPGTSKRVKLVLTGGETTSAGRYYLRAHQELQDVQKCALSLTSDFESSFYIFDSIAAPVCSVEATAYSSTGFTVTGAAISGVSSGESVSSLKLGWVFLGATSGGTNNNPDEADVSSGQYVEITGSGIDSFTSSGYSVTGLTLASGWWCPWIQTTATSTGYASGVSYYSGPWNSGASFESSG